MSDKLDYIKETIEQSMKYYNRHRVFTIQLSYKELSKNPVCLVYPKSQKIPDRWNPCAFNCGVLFRSA